MSDEREIIELNLEESNDLAFKVVVQGATQRPSAYRLVCEDNDFSLCFKGSPDDDGNINFKLPPLDRVLAPDFVYECAVEILVEGRFLRPLQFPVRFKAPIKVRVESVHRPSAPITESSSVNVTLEKKSQPTKVQPKASLPDAVASFDLKAPKKTLREKFEKRSPVTGIDHKTMEEVARSITAKGSEGKIGK